MSTAPILSTETLLQHEPFVRAVARGLLSDEGRVDDVVQQTWLAALRRPPRGEGSLTAWLARVVKNAVRDTHRGNERRSARERAAARPEEEESVLVSQQRLETQRQVVAAVLALAEPYRSVVLLRYYQGLAPREIARRLERKPETVRSQLSRAHELLRGELDASLDGGRGAWSALFLAMLEVPTPTASGGLSTPLKFGLVAAGLASVAVLVVVRQAANEPEPSADLGTTSARAPAFVPPAVEGAGTGLTSGVEGAARASSTPQAARPAPADATVTAALEHSAGPPVLRARLVCAGEVLVHEPVQATVSNLAVNDPSDASYEVTTDALGTLLLESTLFAQPTTDRSLRLLVMARTPEGPMIDATLELPRSPWSGELDLGDVVLEIPPLALAGVITDPSGAPVAGAFARVAVEQAGVERRDGWVQSTLVSDEGGRFALHRDMTGIVALRLSLDHPGFQPRELVAEPGRADLRIRLTPRGGTPASTGTVKAHVRLGERIRATMLEVLLVTASRARVAPLDETGRVSYSGVQPGSYSLEFRQRRDSLWGAQHPAASRPRGAPAPGQQRSVPGYPGGGVRPGPAPVLHSVAFDIEPGREALDLGTIDLARALVLVRITCVDSTGEPVPRARASSVRLDLHPALRASPSPDWTEAGEDGVVELLLPRGEPGDYDVSAEGYATRRLRSVSADTRVVLEPPVHVRVETPLAAQLQAPLQLRAELVPRGVDGPDAVDFTVAILLDADGRGELAAPWAGEYDLVLQLVHRAPRAIHQIQIGMQAQPVSLVRADTDEAQRIVATASVEEYEAALARLRH